MGSAGSGVPAAGSGVVADNQGEAAAGREEDLVEGSLCSAGRRSRIDSTYGSHERWPRKAV